MVGKPVRTRVSCMRCINECVLVMKNARHVCFLQGQVVQGNVKSGVIMNQKDLALQNVKRQQAGNYSCLASNVEGDGESNVVRLTVMCKGNLFSYACAYILIYTAVAGKIENR